MIKLNNEWYIEADNCCYSLRKKYTLEEKEKKLEACKDKDKTIDDYENDFEIYGYYSTMESAINGYIKKCMRDKVAKCQISDISAFLKELKDCGVKGLRFDAAKHIGLPSDGIDFYKRIRRD